MTLPLHLKCATDIKREKKYVNEILKSGDDISVKENYIALISLYFNGE